ncbi:MAG: ABC-F family ATP-binding cassette domain-containing protein [Bacteroidetes bacterium]|nr:ABC-F family ATP-binding cassette domain-containing protein [Bacteroidota bacterium]
MNLLSADNISYSAGDKILFTNLNFGISKGDKFGLIGVNGTGKSTLLKILAGIMPPETGNVSVRKETNIGYLGQNPELEEEKDVFDNVFNNKHKLTGLIKEYEALLEHADDSEEYLKKLDVISTDMHLHDAWSYEARVKEIISRLGIGDLMHQAVKYLSGGQKKRVALAKILAEEPDVLILDEPTNHLDMDTVEWLQQLIHDQFETLLVVTHDRYFLDGISNQIIELERGNLYKYSGNYAYFLEKKSEREENMAAELEKDKNLFRKELEWMRRMPKARGTKSKSRITAFEDLKEKISGKKTDEKIQLEIKDRRQGGKILEARGIGKTIGEKTIIDHFRHYFQKGEKVGIIGQNGCGKTTLLRLLTGQLHPDKGDVVIGENTAIGYYSQEEDLPATEMNKRLIDVVNDIAPNIELADGSKVSASQFLTRFKFPPQDQYKLIQKLSGGERKRLQLLKILLQNPNFLVLDEPTNDLDIETLNVLEEFLENFRGSVVLVSHDRYFMDRVADHVFVFTGDGGIMDFPGNYTDYKEWKALKKQETKAEQKKESAVPDKKTENKPKGKLSFKEQRELEEAENKMNVIEERKKALLQLLDQGSADHEELIQWSAELQRLDAEHETYMNRWIELSS